MSAKPSYSELQERINVLEQKLAGHKDAERFLKERRNQLYTVLDSLEAIVYVSDMHSYEILFANRYTEKIFGPIIGRTCWQVLQADMTGPCPFCPVKDLVAFDDQGENVIAWEMQNTINGRWYSVRDRTIAWFDGRMVHLQIALDISDRKKVETALRESEEKYRTVADYTYDWEYWINDEGGFNYISPSFTEITGYDAEELKENPALLEKIIHPDHRSCFKAHVLKELENTDVYHLEFCIMTRWGEERWISHTCQPVYSPDRRFIGRRASNRDITGQKKAQKDIKLNELRQVTLLNLYNMQDLPVGRMCDFVLEASLPLTASRIGFLGFLNDDESRMVIHSWSKSVMEHCKIYKKSIVFDIQNAGLWGEAVRRRQPIIINNYESSPLKRGIPEGHVGIERFMAVPLFDSDGIVAVAAVGNKRQDYDEKDIRQLQLLMEGMWQIIKRRQAEDELIRQSELIKQFTNTVSHDLKNPAMAINGLARVLKRKHKEMSREKLENFLEQILKSSEQVVALSEDINTYISTREAPLHMNDLELADIWRTIREEFVPRLRKRKVEWVEETTETPTIRADQNALLRVYRNLVDNALKYGGSDLSEIILGYEVSDTHHILSVQNNGEIIPAEDIALIFEIFKRAAGGSAPAGTGLGLAIVKEIARQHNGNAWVASDVESNTTFYISIARNL